jgi:hypothetical protein
MELVNKLIRHAYLPDYARDSALCRAIISTALLSFYNERLAALSPPRITTPITLTLHHTYTTPPSAATLLEDFLNDRVEWRVGDLRLRRTSFAPGCYVTLYAPQHDIAFTITMP